MYFSGCVTMKSARWKYYMLKTNQLFYQSKNSCFIWIKAQWTYLFTQRSETVQEALPEVFEEGTVNFLQTVLGAGINADVKLCNRHKTPIDREKELEGE